MSRIRNGFALNELVMVLFVSGVLASLLLPSIQEVREDARANTCADQLRKISRAALDFEDANKRLPEVLGQKGCVEWKEWTTKDSPIYYLKAQSTGVVALVMPFMELAVVYNKADPFLYDHRFTCETFLQADQTTPIYTDLLAIPGYFEVAYCDVPSFTCPSDNILDVVALVDFIIQPVDQLGTGPSDPANDYCGLGYWIFSTPDGMSDEMGRTNYGASAGAHSGGLNRLGKLQSFVGPTGIRERRTSNTIPDGSSNTILYGEILGSIKPEPTTDAPIRDHVMQVSGGALIRGRGSVPWMKTPVLGKTKTKSHPEGNDPRETILGSARFSSVVGFGSNHPEGVTFSFGDGAIRMISRDIDWEVLYSYYGQSDGKPLTMPAEK